MISRKEIKGMGFNKDYIQTVGEMIVKEASGEWLELGYILEKTGMIDRFIREVEEEKIRKDGGRE